MKKGAFFAGLILVFFGFYGWQRETIGKISSSLRAKTFFLTPLGEAKSEPKVLGEVTTVESDYDFGQIRPEKEVLARGAFFYDLTDRRLIYEKNPHEQLDAASTIKIVTAAVAIDRGNLDEQIAVNLFPTIVGESSMFVRFGEKYTLQELLYGLLMVSGNDVAEAIAQGVGGKREVFVGWMNEFASKAGARNTNFTTASGLNEEGQYTTAYDLFMMGKYVFENYPLVLEITTTKEKYLPATKTHQAFVLRNKLLLLESLPILGGKPGLGDEDMLSLVAMIEKNNHRIIAVLIRTPSLIHDLNQIIEKI